MRMSIAKLRHTVTLCSQKDVVETGGDLKLKRHKAETMWAAIEPKNTQMFSPTGAAMRDSRDRRSHVITIRMRPDLEISALAWIYEQRRLSSARWFKVLAITQTEIKGSEYYMMDVRLVERGDSAPVPREEEDVPDGFGVAGPLPPGVHL